MHDVVGRFQWKTLEALLQTFGTKHHQHHFLLKGRAAARDAALLAHQRMAAVATDDVLRFQHLPFAAIACHKRNARGRIVLRHTFRSPTEKRFHRGQRGHTRAQHFFGQILRQPVVRLKVILLHQLPLRRRAPEITHQIAVDIDAAGGHCGGHDAFGAQFVDAMPEVKMLQRSLREVLSLGNALRHKVAFHQRAGNTTLPQFNRQTHTYRAAAHNHDLKPVQVHCPTKSRCVDINRALTSFEQARSGIKILYKTDTYEYH